MNKLEKKYAYEGEDIFVIKEFERVFVVENVVYKATGNNDIRIYSGHIPDYEKFNFSGFIFKDHQIELSVLVVDEWLQANQNIRNKILPYIWIEDISYFYSGYRLYFTLGNEDKWSDQVIYYGNKQKNFSKYHIITSESYIDPRTSINPELVETWIRRSPNDWEIGYNDDENEDIANEYDPFFMTNEQAKDKFELLLHQAKINLLPLEYRTEFLLEKHYEA